MQILTIESSNIGLEKTMRFSKNREILFTREQKHYRVWQSLDT